MAKCQKGFGAEMVFLAAKSVDLVHAEALAKSA
jgi:hypothetical protein